MATAAITEGWRITLFLTRRSRRVLRWSCEQLRALVVVRIAHRVGPRLVAARQSGVAQLVGVRRAEHFRIRPRRDNLKNLTVVDQAKSLDQLRFGRAESAARNAENAVLRVEHRRLDDERVALPMAD